MTLPLSSVPGPISAPPAVRPPSAGSGAVRLPTPSPRARRTAEAAILLVMFTWGANVVAVKAIIADVPPLLFAFCRFGLAFLVLLAVLKWREGSVGLPRRDVVPLFLLGLAGFGLYQDLWASALGQTTAANSAGRARGNSPGPVIRMMGRPGRIWSISTPRFRPSMAGISTSINTRS